VNIKEALADLERWQEMVEDRLTRQVEFLVEIDKLKTVFRRSYLADASRRENSAEHSWHVAMMAMVLAEHCQEDVDLLRVIKMLLVHDIVEVDAGDTGIYDDVAAQDKNERETLAAGRVFGLLPPDQADDLQKMWDEFEQGVSPEARFARALDRLIPLIHNYCTEGRRWKEDGITHAQVLAVNQTIREGSQELWEFALSLINECVSRGYLPED
jgi:putative hydrolase of HD superfamily